MKANWVLLLPFAFLTGTAKAGTKAPVIHLPGSSQHPILQLTPEITVKSLVSSYNAGQLYAMSSWIIGARDDEKLTQVSQDFNDHKGATTLSLSDLQTEVKDDEASVTAQLTIRDDLFSTLTQSERLQLRREGDRWKIVPDTDESFFTNKVQGFLRNVATAIAHPDVVLSRKETATSLSKAKLIALGWLQFQHDHDEENKIGLTTATFKDALMPYLKDEQAFHFSSDEKAPVILALNDNITGETWDRVGKHSDLVIKPDGQLDLDPIELELFDPTHRAVWNIEANKLVLFYEGSEQRLDFRHSGYAIVCLTDGHVQLVNEQQAKSLRWKA